MGFTQELAQLWDYQELDLEVDRIENQVRNSPLRKRLVRAYNYLKDQQQVISRMEAATNDIRTRLLQISAESESSKKDFEAFKQQSLDDKELRELQQLRQKAIGYADTMGKLDKEITQLVASLKAQQEQLDDMRIKVARARKDYPVLKREYEQEVKKVEAEIAPIKQKRDAAAKKLPKALLERYVHIKTRRPNPVAQIIAGQCSGCNMAIASLVLTRVRGDERAIECENCGRILYLTEE
ncbi:MAG: zinc ribbon domain-containing protein [Christensenellales bacterium]